MLDASPPPAGATRGCPPTPGATRSHVPILDVLPAQREDIETGAYRISGGHLPPDVAAAITEIEQRHRKAQTRVPWDIPPADRASLEQCQRQQLFRCGCQIANRHSRRLHYASLPDPADLADQLIRYADPRYGPYAPAPDQVLELAIEILTWLDQEGRQPCLQGFETWKIEMRRRGNAAKSRRRITRNNYIVQAKADGATSAQIARDVAVRFPHLKPITPAQVRNIVAAARKERESCQSHIKNTNDDSNILLNQSQKFSSVRDSSGLTLDRELSPLPDHWVIDTWTANVGAPPESHQAHQLVLWLDAIGDGDEIQDAVRLIHYAGKLTTRSPWAYVASKLPAYIGNSESRFNLEQRAGPEASNYVRINSAHIRDPRAYLAACAVGKTGELAGVDLDPVDADGTPLDRSFAKKSFKRRYGRLPWENPPDPDTGPVEPEQLEQAPKPEIVAVSRETRRDLSPIEAQKSVERYSRSCENAGEKPKLEHGPCRHPVANVLATAMRLEDVVQVECLATGCGCRIYSDRGAIQCPCHWPPPRVAFFQRRLVAGHTAAMI